MVADALAISGKAISVPSLLAVEDADAFFLVRAFGSNLPAYGTGEASPLVASGVEGETGEATTGEACAFLSISARRFRVPPEDSNSFCLRSFSAACFCFHASNFARRSAFFSSSVCVGVAGICVSC